MMNVLQNSRNTGVKAEETGFILAVFIPLVALCLFVCSQVFRTTLAQAHWISVAFFLWPVLLPPVLYVMRRRTLFTVTAAILIPLEILCAFLAEYTLIGINILFILIVLWVNVIPVALYLSRHRVLKIGSWIDRSCDPTATDLAGIKAHPASFRSEAYHFIFVRLQDTKWQLPS